MQSTISNPDAQTRPAAPPLTSDVVDEAFAELPDLAARIDAAQPLTIKRNCVSETERLVRRIGDQMQALDEQRARLVRLLGDLHISCDI